MKEYIKPNILCMAFMNNCSILAGSPELPKSDEEGDDEGNYGNRNGNDRNRGYGTWEDFDDEDEEDY
jgi:hypothetical protein